MSDLPTLYNPVTVTLPAQDAKIYPDSYMISFFVSSPNAQGKQSLRVCFRPYNKSTGEMYPGKDKDIYYIIPDILVEAARVPLFAQTVGYVLASTSLGLHEKTLVDQIADLSVNDPGLPALEAELAQVRAAMGITN